MIDYGSTFWQYRPHSIILSTERTNVIIPWDHYYKPNGIILNFRVSIIDQSIMNPRVNIINHNINIINIMG